MGKIQIDVLGTSFSASAAEDTEYLNKLVTYYKEIVNTIKETSKLSDPMKISILAGITLVDELYKEKQNKAILTNSPAHNKNDQDAVEVERITNNLIAKINEALE